MKQPKLPGRQIKRLCPRFHRKLDWRRVIDLSSLFFLLPVSSMICPLKLFEPYRKMIFKDLSEFEEQKAQLHCDIFRQRVAVIDRTYNKWI